MTVLDSCTENMNQLRADEKSIEDQGQHVRHGSDQADRQQNVSTQQLLFSMCMHFFFYI